MGLTFLQWFILIFSAINIGFSKTGLQGSTMPSVVLMALAFGGQTSSSIVLVMLMIGDVFAIKRYRKHANLKNVVRLIPSTVVGVIVGAIIGEIINEQQFMTLIGIIVVICLLILVLQEWRKDSIQLEDNSFITSIVGVLNGFASMVGNASGPIFNVYILAKNLRKEKMIGTIAWFFVVLNLIKLPFHIFLWNSFTVETTRIALILIPIIYIGAKLGIKLVEYINEKTYRCLMLLLTAVAAIQLLL